MRVAFAFLVADCIPHKVYWKRFLEAFPDDYRVVVHAHKNSYNGDLNATTVKTVPTSWEKTISAHKALLHEALAQDCDRFILLSESCLPVANPRQLHEYLRLDCSYFNYNPPFYLRPGVSHRYRRNRAPFNAANGTDWILPFMWYAEQWYALNRRHMELLRDDKKIFPAIKRCWGDNEIWPLTTIYYNNIYRWAHSQKGKQYAAWKRENQFNWKDMWQHIDGVKRVKLTYTDWRSVPHPHTFKSLDAAILENVRSTGAVFMRKVAANAKIDDSALPYLSA